MKGKPIEPGCLAIVVGATHTPENNGRVVRVIADVSGLTREQTRPVEANRAAKRLGIVFTSSGSHGKGHWRVEPVHGTLLWASDNRLVVVHVRSRVYSERFLRRIDDGDTTEPRVTETHKPKTEEVF